MTIAKFTGLAMGGRAAVFGSHRPEHRHGFVERCGSCLVSVLQVGWLALPVGGALLLWYGLLAAVVAANVVTPPVVKVLLPTNSFLSALPDDAAIVSFTPLSITLVSENQDLASRLYGAGAWIVLPAGLTSCLPR